MTVPLPLLNPAAPPRPDFVPPLLRGRPEGEGWVRLADLERPEVLRQALAAMAEVRGYPDPITVGAAFALITSGGFAEQAFRAGRSEPVPLLEPERTWWRLKPAANVLAVAVRETPEFVPPERLGESLHTLLDGLYAAIFRQTGFPVRGQWAMVTSSIGAWLLDHQPAEPEHALAVCETLFAGDPVLGSARPRVTWFESDGRRHAFTTRRVCCFNYRGRSGHYCSSQCPIVPPAERMAAAIRDSRAG